MRIRSTATSTTVLTAALCLVGAGTAHAAADVATDTTPWKDRVVRHTNVSGHSTSTTLMPLEQATGVVSTVTGTAYAACFYRDDLTGKPLVRQGSVKKIGTRVVGHSVWEKGASDSVLVPAGRNKTSGYVDSGTLAMQDKTPGQALTCTGTDYPAWDYVNATRVTTYRYAVNTDGTINKLLGTYTGVLTPTALQV